MQSTNQELTEREFKYVEQQFYIKQNSYKNTWPFFIFLSLMGLPFILFGDEFYWFGIIIMLVCLVIAYYFHLQHQQTTFVIRPTRHIYQGRLTQRFIGSARNGRLYLFVDEYKILNPIGIEEYLWAFIEKGPDQPIQVSLAVCEETKNEEVQRHYALLKIENEICIDSAIKNHGTDFLKKATRQLYFDILIFMIVIGVYFGLVMSIMEFFDFDESLFTFFVLLMLPGMYYFEPVYRKFFPRDDADLKEKLKCTCA